MQILSAYEIFKMYYIVSTMILLILCQKLVCILIENPVKKEETHKFCI